MLTRLAWLALEVKYLEQAREFYAETLGMDVRSRREREIVFAAGETDLVCRRPESYPRGGLHTHYAFSIPYDEYDDWWDRLGETADLTEHQFGSATSLYLYDPDGNCVELGQQRVAGPGIDGIFEVVLEVEDLDRSGTVLRRPGLRDGRRRGRSSTRSDERTGGARTLGAPPRSRRRPRRVHVDLGFEADDPARVLEAVGDRVRSVDAETDDRVVVRDPTVTFSPSTLDDLEP